MAEHGAHKKTMPKPGTHKMPGGHMMTAAQMKKQMGGAKPKKRR